MPNWWKLGVEVRGRAESVSGLNGVADTRDTYYLHRLRLNSVITVRPWLKFTSQMQDSRTAGYDRHPVPFNMRDPVDLRQAYADIGIQGEQRWALRVGRQPLVFGDMRLVSTSNWSNVGPNYDGVRLTHNASGVRLDFFSTLVVMPGEIFDKPRADRKLSGFYGTFDAKKWHATVETYTFWKSNLRAVDEGFHAGHMDVYTTGIRKVGKLPAGFDYNVEVAMQRGHISGDGLRAWFGHWEAGKRLLGAQRGPRLWLEHNYASGDRHSGDGRRQAFEQLYPTPWNVVGRAVDFASRNLQEPLAGMEWQIARRWKLRSTMRGFWLVNGNDALYTLTGAVYARKPGAASTHVGEEAGGWAMYQVSNHLQLWVGYAHLFAGPFLKEAGRGSSVNYPFAVWTYTL
ncbi:MAG: alginate export family protein [Bryobacteraceae bacterium]